MRSIRFLLPLAVLLAGAAIRWGRSRPLPPDPRITVIEAGNVFLGPEGVREWTDPVPANPPEARLERRFTGKGNARPMTLSLQQSGVKRTWTVFLNDRRLGKLIPDEVTQENLLEIPAGTLRDGENVLRIEPPKDADDIKVGPVVLIDEIPAAWLAGGKVRVEVRDQETGRLLSCRLTVTDAGGNLVALAASPENEVAARPGVVYTREGRAELSLPVGDYEIRAGRGFEWGIAAAPVRVRSGESKTVALSLVREVATPGWIAVDSHIHTLTHSGHGDATLRERILTIAGEGIELAVATEHNHHADYGPAAASAGLDGEFTAVAGNEVTTKQGHFNAFPVDPGAPVPDPASPDWDSLLTAVRATPGVRVVTLNHPRDLHSAFVPFGEGEFDASTGIHRRAAALQQVDAIEVITSGAMQSDIERLYRDWFALLNRGHRLSAVGASDSHDVTRFLLGQGRTYVAAPDEKPGLIDLDRVWQSYRDGKVRASLGLLADLTVNGRFGVGELATKLGETLRIEATVSGPSWTRTDRIVLYGNGVPLKDETLSDRGMAGEKARVLWEILRPEKDIHLVVVASGPGTAGPFWPIPRPYQPTDPEFRPRVLGSTNPIWIDGDGDGRFTALHAAGE